MLAQGDVVLVPVPFTDLSSQKRRPVVVLSNNAYHAATNDFIAVALTSNPQATPYGIPIDSVDLSDGRLNRPSQIRPDKIYTLAQGIVVERFGAVRSDMLDRIRAAVTALCTPTP